MRRPLGGVREEDAAVSAQAERRAQLVDALASSWAGGGAGGAPRRAVDSELEAFLAGGGASLPFFRTEDVAWVTLAPTAAALHREIELLRAWVLPSYGWEDPRQAYVVPGEATGRLSEAFLAASPAGYFRWRCTHADYDAVARRLGRMRALLARRPEHVHDRVPSLLELRQQFRLALVTGAREAAEAAVRAIDHYQLDSAVNTHLMRVRMLDRFGEYAAIVEDPAIDRVLGLRLPQAVRSAVVRAFHAVFVAPTEPEGAEAAATAYRERMHSAVGGLLALAVPEDGPEIARSLAYRAWVNGDDGHARVLLPTAEPVVVPLLQSVIDAQQAITGPGDLTLAFQEALRRGDLRAVQALAPALLSSLDASSQARAEAVDVVRNSLEVLPNPDVAEELAATGDGPTAPPTMPQSWSELLQRLRDGDVPAAERFLALDQLERPGPERLAPEEREAAVAILEELLTDPSFGPEARGRWVAEAALPAFVEDFVGESLFPRPELAPLYLQLLRLWAEHKRGSAYAPDGQVLLALASAVLQHRTGVEREVAQHLIDWWRARPIRAALPFLLEALHVLLDFTAADGPAQQLWLDGATLAGRWTGGLSPTERALWGRLGLQTGFDTAGVDDVLPPAAVDTPGETPTDPVREAGLQKVAIVSLHRRAAHEARALIAERSGATVLVVDETVAGPATRSAQTADVILFVWAATKHAVFRAFDAVKDRVVYVQGSGAASIVLALERWASQQRAEEQSRLAARA